MEAGEERASSSSSSSLSSASPSDANKAPPNPLARRTSVGIAPPLCSIEETTMHLSKIFFLSEWPVDIAPREASVDELLEALHDSSTPPDTHSAGGILKTSIQRLLQLSENLEGRKVLVNVLNQFRSKQVNVGVGFKLLAAVLWGLLTKCKSSNDVHNGKIVMILSQVCEIESVTFNP